eukprot:scaffold94002_cov63-Phaeocystis_antarctica.AAC.3
MRSGARRATDRLPLEVPASTSSPGARAATQASAARGAARLLHVLRVLLALARLGPRGAVLVAVLAARPGAWLARHGLGPPAREGAPVPVGMVPDPLVGSPLLNAVTLRLAASVQAALVQPAVGHHGVEEHGVTTHGLHVGTAVAVLVVAVPRVVLPPLGVEGAREEGLAAAALFYCGQVPEDGGQPIAAAVLHAREHLRLLPVVVGVEEVSVGAVLLARHVAHHLDVLAQLVGQAREVVCALLQRADLRRSTPLHERLRRGAHVHGGAAAVHHREAARLHARHGVAPDEGALLFGQEVGEHEHQGTQRGGRHLHHLVAAGRAICHRDGHPCHVPYPHPRPDELASRVQVEHSAAAEVLQVRAALDGVAHLREDAPRVGREVVVGGRDHGVDPLELEVQQLLPQPAHQRAHQVVLRLRRHVQQARAALDGPGRIARPVV